jgi:hypothetical protein
MKLKYATIASALCLSLAVMATPAQAALTVVSPCDPALTNPDAIACAGYYSGNLINGSAEDIANQQEAIASLPGDFTFDGNWDALDPEFKIEGLVNGQIDFGVTLFGETIIGAHFGNVAGEAGNVSVFWLFDFGTEGADFVSLDDPQGFSNAVLYTTAPIPEPATWAMMIAGFGLIGGAMRRRRSTATVVTA